MAQDEITVEAVFGQAEGQLEPPSGIRSEFLPFLFALVPKDAHHVRFSASDFHAQTWQADFSAAQLEDLREVVGIAGTVQDFLSYLRAALSSNSVKLILKGLDDAAGGGVVTCKVLAQKTKKTPFISLSLTRLEGAAADDAKASIAFGNFGAFLELSSTLASEKAQASGLKAALAVEEAKAEKLQEQINAASGSYKGGGKVNRTRSTLSAAVSQLLPSLPSTQLDSQAVLPSLPAAVGGAATDGKGVEAPRAPGNRSRVPVAPTARRVKRRGTVIREETDDK